MIAITLGFFTVDSCIKMKLSPNGCYVLCKHTLWSPLDSKGLGFLLTILEPVFSINGAGFQKLFLDGNGIEFRGGSQ